jgi:thioredoxin 1
VRKKAFLFSVVVLLISACGSNKGTAEKGTIETVQTYAGVTSRIEKSSHSLIAFDLYADWCVPCRILAPTLETIALDNKSRVTFFRVNVDDVPEAAQFFKVSGIPLVVFVKDKEVVGALTGVQPREEYLKIIDRYAGKTGSPDSLQGKP